MPDTGCTAALRPAARSTLNPAQPRSRPSVPAGLGEVGCSRSRGLGSRALRAPGLLKATCLLIFPTAKLLLKTCVRGILRGCPQPSELFVGVWCGPHWGGMGKGGKGAGSAEHRPAALPAPRSGSSPVLLALVPVLLLSVKKESCFRLI